jgi:ribosomal protein S18 acetylase RimI-like enzyme
MHIRPASAQDQSLLAHATLENINRSGQRFSSANLHTNPKFRHYFEPWPGERDFGFVATTPDDESVGVVWVQFFSQNDPAYGFVREDVPELSIWMDSAHRGQGIGSQLLARTFEEARSRGIAAISLYVEEDNPAQRLYRRSGFVPIGAEGVFLATL